MRPALLSLALALLLPAGSARATDVGPGDVSGSWVAAQSPFVVQGDITVPAGQSLSVDPGVDVRFAGSYDLVVEGALQAVGTAVDSIRFVPDGSGETWGHLEFRAGASASTLSYCAIRGGNALGNEAPFSDFGGGVLQEPNVALTITHSSIEWCVAASGGGIAGQSGLSIEDCVIRHCEAAGSAVQGRGGGVRLEGGASIANCVVSDNIGDFVGGGIHAAAFNGQITGCAVQNNVVQGHGGGIAFDGGSAATVQGNFISGNDAGTQFYSDGGGVYFWYGGITLTQNTVVGNTAPQGAGLAYGYASPTFDRVLVAFNEGDATYEIAASTASFQDVCVWGNTGTDTLAGSESGTLLVDPLFCDAGAGDYTLCADSACLPLGIGALGQGCDACQTVTADANWSRVKSLY